MSNPGRQGAASASPAGAKPPEIALAIDAGGTTSRCLAVTADGDCLGWGVCGPANPTSTPPAAAIAALTSAAGAALAAAGAAAADVGTIAIAMAGGFFPADLPALHKAFAEAGLRPRPRFLGDPLAAFLSGGPFTSGVVLVVGTGTVCVRFEDRQAVAVADGLGWLLGDSGGGFWIGREVVRAVAADLDRRGPATELTGLLLEALGQPSPAGPSDGRPPALDAMIEVLYSQPVISLARFARLAFAAGADPVAGRIRDQAAAALLETLQTTTAGPPSPLVLAGGILNANPQLVERLVAGAGDGYQLIRLVPDGLAGAARLALEQAGIDVTESVFERITTSLAALRGQGRAA